MAPLTSWHELLEISSHKASQKAQDAQGFGEQFSIYVMEVLLKIHRSPLDAQPTLIREKSSAY